MNQDTITSTTTTETPVTRQRKTKVIKRYGNRKLYDTEQSSYVVLNDIAKMIRNEEEVRVIDNETKDDITSATLTQIIFGAEKKSHRSTPLNVLKSIIKKGDGSFSNFLAEMGLFKANLVDEKVAEAIEKKDADEANLYAGSSVKNKDFQQKSIQERVVSAVLNPTTTEESTILPTSKNFLTSTPEEEE